MDKQAAIDSIVKTLKVETDRQFYASKNSLRDLSTVFESEYKNILKRLLAEPDSEQIKLLQRLDWLITPFPEDIAIIEASMPLLGLLRIYEIGIPIEETPELKNAIVCALNEFVVSDIANVEDLKHYPAAKKSHADAWNKFSQDIRFKDIFASLAAGNYI